MNKHQKNFLGILGLILVIATTVFAMLMPSPKTSATTSSVTDTITVRVVGATPRVDFQDFDSGSVLMTPENNFLISYENVETVTITVRYIDLNGVEHTYEYPDSPIDANYEPGTYDLSMLPYQDADNQRGYGEYYITVTGEGVDGIADEDVIHYYYYPIDGTISDNDEDGNMDLELTYDQEQCSGVNLCVDHIVINVYDENGNLVPELSPIEVDAPTTNVKLPFADQDLPYGTYTVKIIPYDQYGNYLGFTRTLTIEYKGEEEIPVPNTGSLFGGLNISKTDYLVTGLIIFGITGIGGLVFISKRSKKGLGRRR